MIDRESLRKINYIIEHDTASSTYKYVLLKSVINAAQKYDHLINIKDGKAHIPIGLIVRQWTFDYMPFVFKNISQQNNGTILDKPIMNSYFKIFELLNLNNKIEWEYAYIQFIKAYENPSISDDLSKEFLKLSRRIAKKIVDMPMRYIGKNEYDLFMPQRDNFGDIKPQSGTKYNVNFLIELFDYFVISEENYNIFRYLGQTLYGTSTIISKWKEKTLALNKEHIRARDMIDKLSSEVFEERNTNSVRSILDGENECVWSGKKLVGNAYDVDHVLPFSVWNNNDLWNMLPTNKKVNQIQKKTKIPSQKLIERRADVIKMYWKLYMKQWPELFKSQVKIALIGNESELEFDNMIESLCKKSHYLIVDRGHDKFDL